MKLVDRFDLSNSPFEGDRTLILRSLPVNARVIRAIVKLAPASGPTGKLFEEIISFSNGQGDWGTTKINAPDFVEVDFHKRRTLARVTRTGPVTNANLQVDLGGGVYMEINDRGAIRAPGDNLFPVPGDGKLPGLTVTKFKLTPAPPAAPGGDGASLDISRVTIRSTPSNVSVRLGNLGPFWTHLGELTTDDVSPDFASILQAFLADSTAENGFYNIPLVLHSDTIARLHAGLDIEYQIEASVMPEGLSEIKLPFDFDTLPKAREHVLQVDVPANMQVAPGGVTAHVRGIFEESRIAYGPKGAVIPEGAAEVSPISTMAQMILLPETIKAIAFDLLMAVEQTAMLQLDLREDLDGKPGSVSFLPGTVKFKVPAPVNPPLNSPVTMPPHWVSVPLPAEFKFHLGQRYWLVLQSLEGQAAWSAAAASAESGEMQHTRDGGLSWRNMAPAGISDPVRAFFRLRHKPERFEVPIELQIGDGEHALRVSLDRFQPLGRVDFAMDIDKIADAFNQYLDKAMPSACLEIEHLANGDFERWRSVGDKLGEPVTVPSPNPTMVATSPDSRLAYVGADDEMRLIDVACNRVLDEKFRISGVPKALVFHPSRDRAYLLGFDRLQIIDTNINNTLGNTLTIENNQSNALAISPDGSLLYFADNKQRAVSAVDTLKWEQALLSSTQKLEDVIIGGTTDLEGEATAIAISPNGRRLYVAIRSESKGSIKVFDLAAFDGGYPLEPIDSFDVGPQPKAISLTPDGRLALVISSAGADAVSIIDTKTRAIYPIKVQTSPVDIAMAPDGKRAYVAHTGTQSGAQGGIGVIDLTKRSFAGTNSSKLSISLPGVLSAMALTARGDQLYVIGESKVEQSSLFPIRIGSREPPEWTLTSGHVAPFCWTDPFHLVAVLGVSPSAGKEATPKAMPSALSQTVPVSPSCSYEFSFYAIAADLGALAEVLWIGKDCELRRNDEVPIQSREDQIEINRQRAEQTNNMVAVREQSRRPLELHRVRLVAPSDAEQAEVRFSTAVGVWAAVDRVSLKATAEQVLNADLKAQQDGQVAGWNFISSPGHGAAVIAMEDGIQLSNVGGETVEFGQIIPAEGGRAFNLELQGRAIVRSIARNNPRLELHWLKADHSAAGSPVVSEILTAGSGSVLATGTSPVEATEGELRLVVPAGTGLEIKLVSLRFSTVTSIPVTFIAQAPGELTVLNWKVAFEQKKAEAPRIPEKGLCRPTPLGRQPGGTPNNSCYCPCCEGERTIANLTQIMTSAGRPALAGQCTDCGAELIRGGGQRNDGRVPPPTRSEGGALRISAIRHKKTSRHLPMPETVRVEPPLTDIEGIGGPSAEKLAAAGIDTVSKLAEADPETLAEILPWAALELRQKMIKEASDLLR